jgi:vacuolar protein sorting-associated protein 13A/C
MFERILERILLAKIGKFIIGLDREQLKVAVWQGDIILENVHLKEDIFLLWQLPIIIKYGLITRLVIKIPWTKLASEPVEILLQGLYMVVSPQEKENWDYSEEGDIMKRKDYIEVHESRRILSQEQQITNPEEELQKKGYLEKLTARVMDNLKLSIQDIHFRFEYHIENHNFSFGITLESIDCYTTNSYWEREFTDRHQSGSANLAIFKIVDIIGLHLYWKCEDFITISKEQESILKEFMYNKIYEKIPEESILSPSKP